MLRADRESVGLFIALSLGAWPLASVPAAPDWQTASVRVNGVPLELRGGEFRVARSGLAAALLARWQATGPAAPQSMTVGPRTIVGRQRGRLHETVTLRDAGAGRTQVLVAVSDLGVRAQRLPRLPAGLPADQRVLQVVEHGVARGAPRTFVLDSPKTPAVALRQWRRSLAETGWSHRIAAPPDSGSGPWTLAADRGRERLDAVISPSAEGARIVLQVTGDAH